MQTSEVKPKLEVAGQFKFNPEAEPFFPHMHDVGPLGLSTDNQMHDLSMLVDNLVADVQGLTSKLSRIVEEDSMTSAGSTNAQEFMHRLLESLNDLCECTPKECEAAFDSISINKTSNCANLRPRPTLDVPCNTPAAVYGLDKSPCSEVTNRFAMECGSEDVFGRA